MEKIIDDAYQLAGEKAVLRSALVNILCLCQGITQKDGAFSPTYLRLRIDEIERVVVSALEETPWAPITNPPCPVCGGRGGPASGDLDSDGTACRSCGVS